MQKEKSILAIIPARSGSKGLKDKNILLLDGKPLIAYTIEAAIKSRIFSDIIVATDSNIYADIAKKYGASVPFLRPNEISRDDSTSTEVILYTLEQLERMGKRYDMFMLLQPTSPLRSSMDIINSMKLMENKNANAIVSMCETNHSKDFMIELEEDYCLEGFLKNVRRRRQDKKKTYMLNGAIYLSKTEYYKENRDFYGDKCYAYIMDKYSSVDIDDIYDFKYAEILLKMKKSND